MQTIAPATAEQVAENFRHAYAECKQYAEYTKVLKDKFEQHLNDKLEASLPNAAFIDKAATLRKLNAWQKSELKSLYKVIEELVGKDNACLSYSVLDVQEGIYGAIYHDRSANRIQRLRNSLQGILAKAMLDTEHIGKKHYAKVENTLVPLATINKEISAK